MSGRTYASLAAMRAALEQPLLAQSRSAKLPLDRLCKEAAIHRLLARIAAEAPVGSWALKGGIAMIARVGDRARATSDADATWRVDKQMLHEMLDRASVLDLNDNFEFIIGRGKPIRAEGPEGGLRFPVTARMASKVFEALRLEVNLVDHDPRPLEEITPRNLLDFAGIPPVTVPAIRPEHQLAEKLHAYTRDYGSQDNGRSKYLYDMLVIAQELTLPTKAGLTAACRQTFALRGTSWPPVLGPRTPAGSVHSSRRSSNMPASSAGASRPAPGARQRPAGTAPGSAPGPGSTASRSANVGGSRPA